MVEASSAVTEDSTIVAAMAVGSMAAVEATAGMADTAKSVEI
jgi:hypothetical protein